MAGTRGRAVKPRAGARLFFYGTLLDADIQKRVTGRVLALSPAALPGYRRVRAAGKWFPILVPGLGADRVAGAVAERLSAAELARIVAYENDGYALKRVTVLLAGGEPARALAFLPIKGAGHSLKPTSDPWELADWQAREKPRVLRLGLWP
ncbi:MAG: gamma-glutamylcyclotransferase family protein [Rhodospirillales bacterium]